MNNKFLTGISIVIIIGILVFGFFMDSPEEEANPVNEQMEEYQDTQMMLDTVNTIRIYGSGGEEEVDGAFDQVSEIDDLFNIYDEDSNVSQINRVAGEGPVELENHTFTILEKGLEYAELSEGAFDPSIGALIKLWGWGSEDGPSVPGEEEIEATLPVVNYQDILIDSEAQTVEFNQSEMLIDLGAIAKGYAGELATDYLEDAGIETAFVNLGGNIVLLGEKPDGTPWRIGVQDPRSDRGELMGLIVADSDYFDNRLSISTSGDYERYFEEDGERYHHIVSPFTGYSVDNGIASTTIVASDAVMADALSTGVFVLGLEDGLELAENVADFEVIFVTDNREVYLSSGLEGNFEILNDDFEIVEE
ncbi:MAG: FAD:protein FMN transferase [Halarsenatibacteraceae bacterium]